MSIGPRSGEPGVGAERTARKGLLSLAGARRRFAALPRADAVPAAGPLLEELQATLRAIVPPARHRILDGPDVRGFLAEAWTWLEVLRVSRRVAAGAARHGVRAGPDGGRAAAEARLFELVARTQHLVTLVPRGRIDPGFPGRCRRFARGRLENAAFDLGALVLGLRLARPRPGSLSVPLWFAEDAEQGRPGDRIDLGTVCGPTGALGIVLTRGLGRGGTHHASPRKPLRLEASLNGTRLVLRRRGRAPVIVAGAGTPLHAPDLGATRGSGRDRRRGAALRVVRRETLPGTTILLAPRVLSGRRRLRVLREAPGLGHRLGRALRIVRVAWPEAAREIVRRTRMIVPIRETGTVSYSMAARPGISFINVTGKSLVDLADDLLHETAHHRLHDLQWGTDLLVRGPETRDAQAFDSPWRGTLRPLHGLLHGAYTFLFRAELFRRILASRRCLRLSGVGLRPAARRFVRRELIREKRMLASALGDLGRASRAGLLTPAGRRLLRLMRAWSDDLGRG